MKVELVKGKGGWRLRLKAANGEIVAVSEAYFSRWGAKRAAKKNFPGLPLVDAP